MSFEDSYKVRIKKIIKDPKKNISKAIPFIVSRLNPYKRKIFEFFHLYKYSTPYSNHKALLKVMTKKDGFFVQCGGNDGYSNDPTYFLERRLGWTGIIVEPLPIYKLCQTNRPGSVVFNCAACSLDNTQKNIEFIDCNAMSFIKGSINNDKEWISAGETSQKIKAKTVNVAMQPIQSIIDEYFSNHQQRQIDLFVADTEGYELEVIKGIDFVKNKPTYILLEIQTPERLGEIESFLKNEGYIKFLELKENDFLFMLK